MSSSTSACFLSESVIGAIVGGVIGISGTVAVLIFEYRRWEKALRLEHLRQNRTRMEDLFTKLYSSLSRSFGEYIEGSSQNFSIETHTDIDFLCPPEVREELRHWMRLDPEKERVQATKQSLASISICMKSYLQTIDDQIDREIGVKKT